MTVRPSYAALLLASTLAACSSSSSTSVETNPDSGADTGAAPDSGPPKKDSGKDAAKDTGGKDTGTNETGPSSDGGSDATTDSGTEASTDGGFDGPGSEDATSDAPVTAEGGEAGSDGGADSATDGSTTPPPYVAGTPLTATAETWTWVDFPGAVCANGSATGLGINLSSTPNARVLFYLEGGGACWNNETCYTLKTASYVSGYTASDFANESTETSYLAEPGGFFDRTADANPFKDYNYVYVPYCSGDVFSGNSSVTAGGDTLTFHGYNNITEYLDRVVPTFPNTDRVILAGSSAGGIGAIFNWEHVQNAFGDIRVDLIDDSGTLMPADVAAESSNHVFTIATTAWNTNTTLPAGCTACQTDYSQIFAYYSTEYPNQRAALLSYTTDTVLPTYYGLTAEQFTDGLNEDITTYFNPVNANLNAFLYSDSGHVLFFTPSLTTDSVTLQTFITQMVTDDAGWTTEQ